MCAACGAACEPMRAAALTLERALPHGVEGRLHVGGGRAFDAHRGIAPVTAMARCLAHPLIADADAAGDADRRIDDEQLAVIARDETEPCSQAGRIEHAKLHVRFPKCADE